MILVLDTSAENIFFGLWDDEESVWASREEFVGGRELNTLIIQKLDKVLSYSQEYESTLGVKNAAIKGIIVAAGPGSFTGLRIGMSVANTIAYVKNIPIVAVAETETAADFLQKGLNLLKSTDSQFQAAAVPFYGSEPHITKPKRA